MMSDVSTDLGKPDAPPAARAARPGWRDPRLWIGVALVAVSVLAGARLVGGADDTIEVWAATAELAPGQPVGEAELTARRVRFDDAADAARYLRVGETLPDDATAARAVGAGELVPVAALGGGSAGLQEVPVWAPYDAVPGNLEPGAVVDVWVTPRSGESEQGARLVLDDVVVIAAPRRTDGLGPSGNRQVLVGVPPEDAEGLGLVLAAAKDDRVALVREG